MVILRAHAIGGAGARIPHYSRNGDAAAGIGSGVAPGSQLSNDPDHARCGAPSPEIERQFSSLRGTEGGNHLSPTHSRLLLFG